MLQELSTGRELGFAPLRIAARYAIFGLLWIWLSDSALNFLGFDPNRVFLAGAVKGTAFVVVTAGLIYWLVRREVTAAHRAESLLRAVVEGTSDAVFVKDTEGRYLLVNPAAAQFFGKSVADILGQTDRQLLDAATAAALIETDKKIMAENRAVTLDEILPAGGSIRTYHVTKAPFRETSGQVSGLIGIARDITERQATSDALRNSAERYRELANAIPQIVWTADPSGRLTHINANGMEYLGLHAISLKDWAWENAIHPDDRAQAAETWTMIVRERRPRAFEMRIRNSEGQYRWHITRQRPIFDPMGKLVSWVGTNTDIDDLKQAENTLRETEARLREAQRFAKLGSWSWEPQTGRVWWSVAEFELFGVRQDDIQPSFEAFLAMLHPDDRPTAIARVNAMLDGAEEFADDLRVIRPDGTVLWIHSRGRASRDSAGRIVLVEGIDQDVTQKILSEQKLRAEHDRIEKLMEAVPVAICSFQLTPDGHMSIPYASHRIEPLYGFTPESLAIDASPIFGLVHQEDVERVRKSVLASAESMTIWHDEYRVHSPILGDIWVEGCSAPVRLSDGTILWHGYVTDVTARRQMDDALRASERRLRLALDAAGSVAFTWDIRTDSVKRYVSTKHEHSFSWQDAATLKEIRTSIHPDDLEPFDRQLAECLAKGDDYRNAYRLILEDQSVISVEEYGYIDRAEDGTPLSMTGISLDVTEREVAAQAIRVSEARYRQLVDLLPTAIFVYAQNQILYGNPAFLRLIGASKPEELMGRSPFELARPEDHDALRRSHDLLNAGTESVPGFEMRMVRQDGRLVPVYSFAARISGYGASATLVAVTDLTERERATQLLRSVLSSVGDAILTINEHGVIDSANPAAAKQFGYSDDELLGLNVAALMPVKYAREHSQALSNYLRTGEAKVIGIGREVECVRRDQTHFTAELSISEFLIDGERRFTGVLRDITERQRLQAQFIQAQKMEAVGRLAGGVAHDFNNLLTIISGYCDFLMLSELPSGGGQREAVATIRDAGERAARLTQQLLAFSRKAVIEPKLLDLNELVADSARLLRRLIGEDILLAVVTAQKPIRIKADPGQLEQVIMNLVVNARDAMPTGGRLTIETSVVEQSDSFPGPCAQLSVSDTGTGISDEVKAQVFEPFFTTKGVGKGTGLGLAVVHGVITQNGGQVLIDSSVGEGSTFRILLPLVRETATTSAADSIRFANRGTETILLVEDDAAVRKITRLSLETQGYRVLEADGGANAIRIAETYPDHIHLIVSDVVMPEMGGRQLLNAVRQYRPGLRVLFISGYTDDAVLLHGVLDATDSFMPKPFTPLTLARKVREVIDAPAQTPPGRPGTT